METTKTRDGRVAYDPLPLPIAVQRDITDYLDRLLRGPIWYDDTRECLTWEAK